MNTKPFPSPQFEAMRLVDACANDIAAARAVAATKSDCSICASNAVYWMQIAEALRVGVYRA